jgi:hypothetical protein
VWPYNDTLSCTLPNLLLYLYFYMLFYIFGTINIDAILSKFSQS